MAKSFAASDQVKLIADRIKQMPKYRAMYYGEGPPRMIAASIVCALLYDMLFTPG